MSRYILVYKPAAKRSLAKLPLKVVDAIVNFCDGPLLDNPYRVGKPLRNKYAGSYYAKRGSYRIIYLINDYEVIVTVARIEHRADIYKPE
ncbi:type II toxin-antitoxin system RelE/ParE family toxin [Rhodoluna sp.]|uniref:type II toxin-antitoxin system RelE family toxin n=1 Tax=Rhodoluna sp. TaxID=1969481 RepID=UPI0025D1D5FC|nr:type II toxin-antitoxin system RelE/ParE family toxin [Rhodoluna sp.]